MASKNSASRKIRVVVLALLALIALFLAYVAVQAFPEAEYDYQGPVSAQAN